MNPTNVGIHNCKIYHLGQTPRRNDIAGMDQTIKMSCALLDLIAHVVIDFHVKDICHELERILIVLNFRVQPGEIETVGEVILVNLAEIFIAFG